MGRWDEASREAGAQHRVPAAMRAAWRVAQVAALAFLAAAVGVALAAGTVWLATTIP